MPFLRGRTMSGGHRLCADCPKWLLPEAKEEWKRLSEKLNQMGVLTEVDRSAFAAYCQSYARWKEAQDHINSEGATYETENGMQRPNPWVAIPSSVIIQLARILHTSPNYILLGEVKEEGWMEEMYELMENIKSPDMRRLALKQLRCVAEVLIFNKFFQKEKCRINGENTQKTLKISKYKANIDYNWQMFLRYFACII